MKQKYLLSMLLGGAMLVACSVDDDLNLSPVAQDVNPSAPVFTVSFDDGSDLATRADYASDKVTFRVADKDLLSLFHGMTIPDTFDPTKEEEFEAGADFSFPASYENAIYEASGTDEAFELKTRAMVKDGAAIMVYPCDTVNLTGANAPKVSIKSEQNMKTMEETPYISPLLKINKRDDDKPNVNGHESGYGRTYDIKLKRAAATFNLKMNLIESDEIKAAVEAEKIGKAEVKSVKLTNSADLFTTSIGIKAAQKDYDVEGLEHENWIGNVSLDNTNVIQAESLSSEAIGTKDGKPVVYMNILPFKNNVNVETAFANVSLIVETTYGDVKITGSNAKKIKNPYKGSENTEVAAIANEEYLTVAEFLRYVVARNADVANSTKKDTKSEFNTEYIGKVFNIDIDVNLKDVDMSSMHIKTGAELKDAITLFNIVKGGTDATGNFYLVGDKAENGDFAMTAEQWNVLKPVLADDKSKLKVSLCTGSDENCGKNKCETITLVGGEDKTNEIPNLLFGEDDGVPVNLAGEKATWTYPAEPDFSSYSSLTLVEGTLNLNDQDVTAKEGALKDGITFKKGANVNVTGEVTVRINTTNKAKINISDTDAALYVEDVKFVNEYAPVRTFGKNETYVDYEEYCWNDCGIIENYGSLGVKNNGEIDNYGLIRMLDEDATVMITSNAKGTSKTDAKTGTAASEDVKIGSITLCNTNPTLSITNAESEKGFIKYTIPSNSGESLAAATYGSVANYIIINAASGIKKIATDLTGASKAGNNMKYLEVVGKMTLNLETENSFTALLIKDDATLSVKPNVKASVTETLYLKGKVNHAGDRVANDVWSKYNNKTGNATFFGKSTGDLIFSGNTLPAPTEPEPEQPGNQEPGNGQNN